jgi:hypothetical protein
MQVDPSTLACLYHAQLAQREQPVPNFRLQAVTGEKRQLQFVLGYDDRNASLANLVTVLKALPVSAAYAHVLHWQETQFDYDYKKETVTLRVPVGRLSYRGSYAIGALCTVMVIFLLYDYATALF